MKSKFAALLLFLVTFCATALGQSQTVTFSYTDFVGQGTSGSGSEMSVEKAPVTINAVGFGSTSEIRIYGRDAITVTGDAVYITKVVLTGTNATYIRSWTASDNSNVKVVNYDATWSGRTSSITLKSNDSSQARLTQIEVTYEPIPANVSITYDSNGGSGTTLDVNSPYTYGAKVTVLDNAFVREGYVFSHWNTEADGSGTSYNPGDELTIRSDIMLYAQWKKTCTIHFYNKGSEIAGSAVTLIEGTELTFPASPTASGGWSFAGWSTNTSDITADDIYSNSRKPQVSGDAIYHAIYAKAMGEAVTGWQLVTDEDGLVSGDIYTIGSSASYGEGYVLGTQQTNNIQGVAWSSASIMTFELGGSKDAWTMKVVGGNYLYAPSATGTAKNNYLKQNASPSLWTINPSSGATEIKVTGGTNRYILRFNSSYGNLFSCYSNTQNDVYLFRQTTVADLVYSTTCDEDERPQLEFRFTVDNYTHYVSSADFDDVLQGLPTLVCGDDVTGELLYCIGINDYALIDEDSGEILLCEDITEPLTLTVSAFLFDDPKYGDAEAEYQLTLTKHQSDGFDFTLNGESFNGTLRIPAGSTSYTLPTVSNPDNLDVTLSFSDKAPVVINNAAGANGKLIVNTSKPCYFIVAATGTKDGYFNATADYSVEIYQSETGGGSGTSAKPIFLETFGDNGANDTLYASANSYSATEDMFTTGNPQSNYTGEGKVGKNSVDPSEGYDGCSGQSAAWHPGDSKSTDYQNLLTISNIKVAGNKDLKLSFGTYSSMSATSGQWHKFKITYIFNHGCENEATYESDEVELAKTTWELQHFDLQGTGNSLCIVIDHATSRGYTMRIDDITITGTPESAERPVESVTVGTSGITTYCSTEDLYFAEDGSVKAYIANGVEDATLVLQRVTGVVESGTALILVAEPGSEAVIPVAAEEDYDREIAYVDDNMLTAVYKGEIIDVTSPEDGWYTYIYGTPSGGTPGFYQLVRNNMNAPKNIAVIYSDTDYLNTASAAAQMIVLDFNGNMLTAVNDADSRHISSAAIYSLQGTRVGKAHKGLYISNGKKFSF